MVGIMVINGVFIALSKGYGGNFLNGFNERNHGHSFEAELLAVDSNIMDAAAAIDAGDFSGALDLFRRALFSLKSARQLIDGGSELDDIEHAITDIDKLLNDIRNMEN